MPTTCLICCQQAQYFLLPPCNHKQMCWKCCATLIEGSTFTCPYCNGTPQGTCAILFVNEEQMKIYTFQQIFKRNPYKSAAKSYQYYSNEDVANFIEESTSFYCRFCMNSFDNINMLKKHLNQVHRKQFCDVCLQNKKCLLSEQHLYNQAQLTSHLKKGEYSQQHQLILYHPFCQFCKMRFYDIDAFRAHLRMSSHLRCHICEQNYQKFKYVYYKDYAEIQKHFYKSHFVCQIGACLGNKLQNVFVSENLLQQHKNRVHNKGGNKSNKQVLNILFFQKNQDQFEWDKIGKDLKKEFQIAEKFYILKNQEHRDGIINIRQFYPQITKISNKMSIDQIKRKLQDYLFKPDYKSQFINFISVPLFQPLQMTSIMRHELQNLLRSVFQPKYSQALIEIFFTRKFQYKSENQYFQDLRRKMWNFCPISYYYLFPQLIRFFKDTNKTKQTMDEFYAQSLRNLKLNKVYVFHNKQRYSDILNILEQQIQSYIYCQMIDEHIDLQVYKRYLKDLNSEFYCTHHSNIFYVQKQKIKNMYHMIEKTKTSQLLKLNWLLKLGLSISSLKIINDKFFYKTIDDCNEWVKLISLQQLALVYAYVEICLQSLIDKNLFNASKANPHTQFLGVVLGKIQTCISSKDLTALRQLENKSIQIAAKLNNFVLQSSNKKKGILINQQEHPSLLANDNNGKKQQTIQNFVAFGRNVNVTPNSNIRVTKKQTNKIQQKYQDFPQLFVKKQKFPKASNIEEQQFPVFNYNQKQDQKIVPKKKFNDEELQKKNNIQKYDLFNPKNSLISQKITQNYYKNKQKDVVQQKNTSLSLKSNDWPTLDQEYTKEESQELQKTKNTKKKKKKQIAQMPIQQPVVTKQDFNQQIFIKKKTKEQIRAEQQASNKKQKRKNRDFLQEQRVQPQKKEDSKINEQQNQLKTKRKKVRLDETDSQEEQRKRKAEKERQREQKRMKFMQQQKLKTSLKYHQDFDTLLSDNKKKQETKQKSIINSLIEQNKKQQKQPQIVIKKGKKGKAVVIEKVNIFDL